MLLEIQYMTAVFHHEVFVSGRPNMCVSNTKYRIHMWWYNMRSPRIVCLIVMCCPTNHDMSCVPTDIDECSLPTRNVCGYNSTCTNAPGSFSCQCHEGFLDVDKDDRDCKGMTSIGSPPLTFQTGNTTPHHIYTHFFHCGN